MLPHQINFTRLNNPQATLEAVSHSHNAVFRVVDGDAQYMLKWFPPERDTAYWRERQMRACLAANTAINFPRILEVVEKDDHHYVLMDAVTGESLLARWRAQPTAPEAEMRRLGVLLADLHNVPLDAAAAFVEPETIFFSAKHREKMQRAIAPYLPDAAGWVDACFCRVVAAMSRLPIVLSHADFGPHQVIVQAEEWVLLDFEFATISPFADDLSGTEARMQRWGFRTGAFLSGYFSVHSRRKEYESIRHDFMAYNLLAIVTYRLQNGKVPTPAELEMLRHLLQLANRA